MIESQLNLLFSATSIVNLASIAVDGMRRGSYWTNNPDISDYYASTIVDEGQVPIILQVQFDSLSLEYLRPDHNGLTEPLTYTLRMSEEQISEAWGHSDKDWQASIEIIGSLRYHAMIAPEYLFVEDGEGGAIPLADYLNKSCNK